MWRYVSVTLLILSGFCLTVQRVMPAENPQPYIYYYSNIEHAIVIEHADGTDSRLLGQGLMPPDQPVIQNFSWSASGKWVAWSSNTAYEGAPAAAPNIWIMKSDGSQRLTVLDNLGVGFYTLKWSPTQDYLMVLLAKRTIFSYVIIDPEKDKIVARTDFQGQPLIYQEGNYADWLETGDKVIFLIQVERTTLLGSLTLDNRTNTRIFQQSNREPFLLQEGRIFWEEYDFSTGKIELRIEDLNNGKVITLLSGVNSSNRFQLIWSPTFDHALLIEQECPSQSDCPNTSPTRISLVNWSNNTVSYIGSDYSPYPLFTGSIWSADGNFVLLKNTEKQAFVFNLLSFQMLPVEKGVSITAWQWLNPKKAGLFIVSDGKLASYFIFDIQTGKTQPLTFPSPASSDFSLIDSPPQFIISSDDGRYFGVSSQNKAGFSIYDRVNKKILPWFSHSIGGRGGIFPNYLWAYKYDWFMTGQRISFAGGGGGPEAIIIQNLDGTIRRELSLCFSFFSCAGFVPERVLPYLGKGNPTSVIQQPIATLHLASMVGFAWSPDSTQLIDYSYKLGDQTKPTLQLWDLTGKQPHLTKEIPVEPIESNQTYYLTPYLTWNSVDKSITLIQETNFSTWDIESGSLIDSGEIPVELSPTHQYRWSKTNGTITILDEETKRELNHFQLQDTDSNGVFWSSDGWALYSPTQNGTVTVWESHGNTIASLSVPSNNDVGYLTANEHYAVAGNQYTIAHVWDISTQKPLKDLNFYPTAAQFSPDGKYLATATNDQITIWNTADLDK